MINPEVLDELERNPSIDRLTREYPNDIDAIMEIHDIIRALRLVRVQKKQEMFEDLEASISTSSAMTPSDRLSSFINWRSITIALVLIGILGYVSFVVFNSTRGSDIQFAQGPSLAYRSTTPTSEIIQAAQQGAWSQLLSVAKDNQQCQPLHCFYFGLAYAYSEQYDVAFDYFIRVHDEALPGYDDDARFNSVICKWHLGTVNNADLAPYIQDPNGKHYKTAKKIQNAIRQ